MKPRFIISLMLLLVGASSLAFAQDGDPFSSESEPAVSSTASTQLSRKQVASLKARIARVRNFVVILEKGDPSDPQAIEDEHLPEALQHVRTMARDIVQLHKDIRSQGDNPAVAYPDEEAVNKRFTDRADYYFAAAAARGFNAEGPLPDGPIEKPLRNDSATPRVVEQKEVAATPPTKKHSLAEGVIAQMKRGVEAGAVPPAPATAEQITALKARAAKFRSLVEAMEKGDPSDPKQHPDSEVPEMVRRLEVGSQYLRQLDKDARSQGTSLEVVFPDATEFAKRFRLREKHYAAVAKARGFRVEYREPLERLDATYLKHDILMSEIRADEDGQLSAFMKDRGVSRKDIASLDSELEAAGIEWVEAWKQIGGGADLELPRVLYLRVDVTAKWKEQRKAQPSSSIEAFVASAIREAANSRKTVQAINNGATAAVNDDSATRGNSLKDPLEDYYKMLNSFKAPSDGDDEPFDSVATESTDARALRANPNDPKAFYDRMINGRDSPTPAPAGGTVELSAAEAAELDAGIIRNNNAANGVFQKQVESPKTKQDKTPKTKEQARYSIYLATGLANQGKYDRAIEILKEVIHWHPDFKPAKKALDMTLKMKAGKK